MKCPVCNNKLAAHQKKFCSNACQHEHQYKEYIRAWQNGKVNGRRGVSSVNVSKHIRRYLMDKHHSKCMKCSWSSKHPITGVVPLEIDHIDGNAENNNELNLQVLCPNCHSLTPHFRNLNKGFGRTLRNKLRK